MKHLFRLLKGLAAGRRKADAEALYWRGIDALMGGDAEAALSALSEALTLAPRRRDFLATRGDALLLAGRENEALEAYRRALPSIGTEAESPVPALAAHPVWLRHLSRVAMPERGGPLSGSPGPKAWSNYGSLLANQRRIAAAASVFEYVTRADPEDGYAWAALALIRTLNAEWLKAIPAAQAARRLDASLFDGSSELCLLAAGLGTGREPGELDDYLDWRTLNEEAAIERLLERLPALDRPMPTLPAAPLVFFIACDAGYLEKHALALALSIREHSPSAAIHLHLFAPELECRRALELLASRVGKERLSTSHETVDFARFGGVGRYCAAARFVRLYQWRRVNDSRAAMIDADSLVRADLSAAMSHRGEVALLRAAGEPLWHAVPACFSGYGASDASARFLGWQAALMAANLLASRPRLFMDQAGLAVCADRLARESPESLDWLPLHYCDSSCNPRSLAWSVTQATQATQAADAFQALKARTLERFGV